MNQLQTALRWLNLGIATIPIGYRSKRPDLAALLRTGDVDENERPIWGRMKDDLPTVQNLGEWFKPSLQNIAVVCGWQNLVIVDFDNLFAHEMWSALYVDYTKTYTVATGKGFHLYFYVDNLPERTLKWWGGDVKSTGYCLVPPSTHPNGNKYKATNNSPIMKIGNIHEILPEELFTNHVNSKPLNNAPSVAYDPYAPRAKAASGQFAEVNKRVRILDMFPDARGGRDGWYSVKCVLHDDSNNSAWINDSKNRYGCAACINGSISVIDLYMRLNSCDKETAVMELSNGL